MLYQNLTHAVSYNILACRLRFPGGMLYIFILNAYLYNIYPSGLTIVA